MGYRFTLEKVGQKDDEFAASLGAILGSIFPSLSENIQKSIWKLMEKKPIFAYNAGSNLAMNLHFLSKEVRNNMLKNITIVNSNYADGIGYGLGIIHRSLQEDLKENLMTLIEENDSFAFRLGTGVKDTMKDYENLEESILKMAEKNRYFAKGLGINSKQESIT
jgi:hypothetical protein